MEKNTNTIILLKGDMNLEDITKTVNEAAEQKKTYTLPSASELRERLTATEGADARRSLLDLFDPDTFSELGVYTARSFSEYDIGEEMPLPEGVICGYGAIDGRLVYAFAQDFERQMAPMNERHAKKILSLYKLALENGAPVVGIFNSFGADIHGGVSSLAAYGHIMRAVTEASGKIPQIAVIMGECTGTAAPIAAMFDFEIVVRESEYHVHPKEHDGDKENNARSAAFDECDASGAIRNTRILLSYLPSNASEGAVTTVSADDPNRSLGKISFEDDLCHVISAIADNGVFEEVSKHFAPEMFTGFCSLGGVRCGIVGNRLLGATSKADDKHDKEKNKGRFGDAEARKAARFVSFCDAFSIPLLTLVDSLGISFCSEIPTLPYASAPAALAFAYASSTNPKITVILGKAIGTAYTILGSKSIGADIVYALDSAEIGPLSTDASVALAWNDQITPDESRDALEQKWRVCRSSAVAAAYYGEVDDIITVDELRKKIISAVYMLSSKNQKIEKRHSVFPL